MDINSEETQGILVAVKKGYYVNEKGEVFSKSGYKRKLRFRNKGVKYWCFGIKDGKRSRKILVHKLQAYQKFGEALFGEDIHIRHKDSNSLNNHPDNLALGSPTQNYQDMPKETRIKRAKTAASYLRKFSEKQIKEIKEKYAKGKRQYELCREYKCAKSTMSYIINNKTYK